MIEKMKSSLLGIGLTAQQSEVYLLLVKLGKSTVAELVKNSGVGRVSCYDVLQRLEQKGLVSFVNEEGSRSYRAASADQLLCLVREKEAKVAKERKLVEKLLPKLEQMQKLSVESEDAFVFRGVQAQRGFFEKILSEIKSGEEIFVLGGTGKALLSLPIYFPQWHRKRVEKKASVRVLFNHDLKDKSFVRMPSSSVLFLKKELSSPTTIFIFGSFVATLHWGENPVTFLIKSKE